MPLAIRPALTATFRILSAALRRVQISDPDLRRKVTPDYVPGCKRVLLTNKWYPALQQPNVELVIEGLSEVRPHSVITADASEFEVDVLVFATGFTPTDPPIARQIRRADGLTLSEAWHGRPQAYLGTTVAGFPNFFLIYGPNVNLGHSSMVYMVESQFRYVIAALRATRERRLERIEVRREAQEAYNRDLQRRLERTVWNTGRCASWYLTEEGQNPIMWSDFTFRFRRLASAFSLGDHIYA
jgi:cation diffusion facilitator CzcD-associated flavoprotein CzcO